MASVVKVIKLKEPKPPRTRKCRVKCKVCGTRFVGEYTVDEDFPIWTCPGCDSEVTRKGRFVSDDGGYDGFDDDSADITIEID